MLQSYCNKVRRKLQKWSEMMNKNKIKKSMVFWCVMVLLVSVLAIGVSNPAVGTDQDILLVELGEQTDENLLSDVEIVDRYGNYALIEGDENTAAQLEDEGLYVNTLPSRTTIHVGGHEFDFTEGEPEISSELRIDDYEPGEKGIYIIHMLGPINSEWVERVEDMGVEVMNYVHNYAYRVRMTPEQAQEVYELRFVDWVGVYQPEYKIRPDLELGELEIGLAPGSEFETIERIAEIADVEILDQNIERMLRAASEEDELTFSSHRKNIVREERRTTEESETLSYVELPDGEFRVMVEIGSEEDLNKIARLNDVYYITEQAEVELHDEMATQTVGGGLWFFDDEHDDPYIPYRNHGDHGSYMNQIGYTGEGITIAIADTGVDIHPDFQDRVIGGEDFTPDGDPFLDGHGHGTHVTGSAAGDTYHGTGATLVEDGYYLAQGSAPGSEIYSAKIFDATGSGHVPSPVTPIFSSANEAGAYVHSNSWGSTLGHGQYIWSSPEFDAAVRDSNPGTDYNEPMVITGSAGNDGEQGTPPPATAKNVIIVGATEPFNPWYGHFSPEYMAGFSSRGFTDDNRVKPDVVAPGATIISTMPDAGYGIMGGTSMSNPAVAGAAAVTIEWYEDIYGYTPSPAMVRSLLINTANPIDGDTRGPIPNEDEGWGMVDISKLQRPDPTPIYTVDQDDLFTTSGMVYEYDLEHEDSEEPLKVTLGWTDKEAPADTGSGPALMNDLNLELRSPGGHVYRGNAFEDGWTQPNADTMEEFDRKGDGWDDTNNVENVYIPADEVEDGVYTVRVIARNIVEDSLGIGGPSQDFALAAYNAQHGEIIDEPPVVELESPVGGESWTARAEEDIEWFVEAGDHDIDRVNLFYSDDGWTTQQMIAVDLDPEVGSFTWDIPNYDTDDAQIRAVAVDLEGNSASDTSGSFTIDGIAPEPAENLLVEHDYYHEETLFYDDVSDNEGYITGSTFGINTWDIRDHGSAIGDQSWDWGDEEYLQVGEVSWLISPEIEIPDDARSAELTFQHWRDIDDDFVLWDGVNLKVSTEGPDPLGEWHLIEDPDPAYDGNIFTGLENPLGGEPGWGGYSDWEEVAVDLSEYAGETINLRWDAGVIDNEFEAREGGWRIDDIEATAEVPTGDPVSNQLRWFASADEDIGEVSYYNIYRAEDDDGVPVNHTHIDTVPADGSEKYYYLDYDAAGEPYNWYLVRAVGTNGLEEDNEDYRPEPGIDIEGPDIEIELPDETSVWDAYEDEVIQWNTTQGASEIDYIDYISYSVDGGETWTEIDEILDDDGEYNWTVPNWPSEEAIIRARVVDEGGFWAENTSAEFQIVGVAPDPAENLDVQHVDAAEEWHWMYPDEHRPGIDNAIGLTGPGIWYGAIRTELPEGELTDIAYYNFDAVNFVRGQVYTDGVDSPGDLIAETETITDPGTNQWHEIPIEGTVNIEDGTYWVVLMMDDIGDGFQPLGVVDPYVEDAGWLSLDGQAWDETIDFGLDSSWSLEAHVREFHEEGNEDNLLTWEASPHDPFDDPREITHYDIYRAENDWEDAVYIGTVESEGLDEYQYIDYGAGMADETYWWYNVTAVAMNELEAEVDEAVREPIPPEISITSPEDGDVLEYGDTWNITWNFTVHQYDIGVVDLYYSLDGGETIYGNVADGVNATDEVFEWQIPDVYSEEAHIIAHVYDVEGNWRANESEAFTIIGEPPAPPEGLIVAYDYYDTEQLFYDDVSEDLGYTTGSSLGVNTWDIRDHDAEVEDQSWDWGDNLYQQVGEVSWLISPEIVIPQEARSAELTFQHWRDLDYEFGPFDGVNLKISTESADPDGEWHLIEDPEPGYDEEIIPGMGNPIDGEPAWTGSANWEEVTVDLSDYTGESIYLRWDAGVMDFFNTGQGWRIDDIEVTAELPQEDPVSNQLRWFASPDEELGEISHYNIYRAEDDDGEPGNFTQVDTVDADGSETYHYLDLEMAGDPYNWYIVRSVDTYGQEEMNDEARPEPGIPGLEPPEITIEQPDETTVWHAYDDEYLVWNITEGAAPIDYVELWYSTDAGETWSVIDTFVPHDEDYNWTVPNWPSEEVIIGARVVDEDGVHNENMTDEFEIIGLAPEPPQNLTVEHGAPAEWNWMYDDEHRAEPYNALGLGVEITWYKAIRIEIPEGEANHIAFHDWTDAISFKGTIHEDGVIEPGEQIGETEIVPGYEEPAWREVPLIEPVELEGGHYWVQVEIHDSGEGFPGSLIQGYVEDAGWITWEGQPWMTLPDLGFEDSWTIEVFVDEAGRDHNLISWDSSENDLADGRPEEVSHYEIYRAETDWEDADHIATVNADGSDHYEYYDLDRGMADDIYWYYNVTAVAHNDMESDHEDAVREPMPPYINITSPIEGDEWEYDDTETITWDITEGSEDVDNIDLWYSLDGGDTVYDQIAEGIDATEEEYNWTIPDVYSEEAVIIAQVYDIEGNWRENSSEEFTIIGIPPEPPQRLLVEHDGVDNVLTWHASPDDNGDISHYNVYRAEERDGPWENLVGSVPADGSAVYEYVDAGAADDPYYWYVVRAVDGYGQEETNEDAKLEPGHPDYDEPWISIDSPEAGDIYYGNTTVEFTFYHGAGHVDQEIAYVDLYGRMEPGHEWGPIVTGLEPDLYEDQPYVYEDIVPLGVDTDEAQIRAVIVDEIGYSDEDITGMFSIHEDNEVQHLEITAPYDGALLPDGTVTVEWESYDERSGIDHFEVRHIDDEDWIVLDDETFQYDFELADGQNTIEVRAWDNAGNNVSDSVTFVVDTTSPELVITNPDHGEIISEDSVLVLWQAYDVTSEIVGYDVQINGEGWQDVELRTWHEFEGLLDGHHTVDVRATDEAGHEYVESVEFHVATEQYLDITSPEDGVESLTFEEDFLITGQTSWSVIHIDGQPVDVEDGVFEYSTTLTEGQNVFLVEAIHDGEIVDETEVYALYLPTIPELWDEIAAVEEDLQGQIDDLQGQIDDLQSDLQEQIDDLQGQIDDLQSDLQGQIDDLQGQIDDLQEDIQEDMDELETNLVQQIDDLEDKLDDLETDLQSEIDSLQSSLDDFRAEQEEIDEEQDDDISMARNLGIVGIILAILALIIGIFAMVKKGGGPTEEPIFEEEESFEDEFDDDVYEEDPFEEETLEEDPFEEEEF